MRRTLFFFVVFRGAIAEVLRASLPAKARTGEITSYESWQWSNLEDE
jgi:hypothetical protein